jgi:hypothetical protein
MNYQINQLNTQISVPVDYYYKSNLITFKENNIPYTIQKIPYSPLDKDLHFFGVKGEKATRFSAVFNENDKNPLLRKLDNLYNKILTFHNKQ